MESWSKPYNVSLEMKSRTEYLVIAILLLLLYPTAVISAKQKDAPDVTLRFVNSIDEMSHLIPDNVNRASELQQQIQACFMAAEMSGINITNSDLYLASIPGIRQNITSQRYSNQLKQLIFTDRSLKMNQQTLETIVLNTVDFDNDEPYLYNTIIKKTLCYNNKSITIWQEIHVPVKGTQLISEILTSSKELKKNEFIHYERDVLTVNQYLSQAAQFYSKKQYANAYKTYTELTEKHADNAEGWYRLSLMIYKQRGCKGNYTNPRATAREYMQRAYELGNGDIKTKAENILFYWDHPNYM